eukprot:GFUD01032449.1.p1 GENE.GFUD01032449.1~~GFUD01032449.1.p1  ORF type:complete len:336 (+),score=92.06 GFUD01032449.1:164-1171(+)
MTEAVPTAEDPVTLPPPLGCSHYQRKCQLVSPCCDQPYNCRFCHDEDSTNHTLDRRSVKEVVCLVCSARQALSNLCSSQDCGTVFGGAYFCGVCKLFDDVDKGQFHCDGCGICRIGGREKFSHCDTCGLCLPAGKSHKCVSNTSHNNCPVCLEDIHTSRLEAHIPPCSHLLHLTCYQDMVRTGLYACPTCGLSMQDMSMVWADIDREVASTPMPREYAGLYREILCKDCNQTGTATFHIVGMKCLSCGSYNTTLDKGPLLRLVSKEGEEKVFTPLTETEIGTLTRGLTMRMVGRRLRRWWRRMVKWLQIQTLERWLKKIWTDFLRMIAYLLGIER